jgi:hypothetical protein
MLRVVECTNFNGQVTAEQFLKLQVFSPMFDTGADNKQFLKLEVLSSMFDTGLGLAHLVQFAAFCDERFGRSEVSKPASDRNDSADSAAVLLSEPVMEPETAVSEPEYQYHGRVLMTPEPAVSEPEYQYHGLGTFAMLSNYIHLADHNGKHMETRVAVIQK